MRKEEVKVDDRSFVVRELLAKEVDDIDFADKKKALKQQIVISTGLSEEEYDGLTFKERNALITKLNELNGITLPKEGFQSPTPVSKPN